MNPAVLLIFFCFLLWSPLRAQEQPSALVRAEIEPLSGTPGQPLRLRVTVLVPTWFLQPPVYPALELPNAVTRLPPNSSFNTNERIAGQNWAGIVRDYIIYPQVAARYELTGQHITLRYADPATNEAIIERVALPAVAFSAGIPAGAEGLSPFLAGTALSLEQSIIPSEVSLQMGDAIERRVSATITGTPAMFLPQLLSATTNSDIKFYPREPRIADSPGARGAPVTGTREESGLYVFERPGNYRLPGISLRWWNGGKQVVETASLPAITLEVKPPPGADVSPELPVAGRSGFDGPARTAGTGLALLMAGLLAWRYARSLRIWIDRQMETHRATEGHAFRRVMRSLRPEMRDAKDVAAFYNNFYGWLHRLAPGSPLEALLRSREVAKLLPSLQALGRSAYGPAPSAPALDPAATKALRIALKSARKALLHKKKRRHRSRELVPLYPRTGRDTVGL